MPERRLRRFAQLEQARPARSDDALAPPSTSEPRPGSEPAPAPHRFDGLDVEPSAPDLLSAPARSMHAFTGDAPAPEPALELATRDPEVQPFVRCCHCGVDSTRGASTCRGCASPLETPEQHAFNAAYWAELRAGRASQEEAREQAQREQMRVAEETARANRALYEGMARDVGDAERRRLAREGLFRHELRLPRGLSTRRLYGVGVVLFLSLGVASCGMRRTVSGLLLATLFVVGRAVLPAVFEWLRARAARRP